MKTIYMNHGELLRTRHVLRLLDELEMRSVDGKFTDFFQGAALQERNELPDGKIELVYDGAVE